MTKSDLDTIIEITNKATKAPWTSYSEGRDFESGSSFIMTGWAMTGVMIWNCHI
ncbi:hypothetical protein [Flavobacterium album]|uniref:hypothetical protein n=1 Tax=Flavobacterium album TaxID=2175091 RepID=UPI001C63B2A4|nr:hypothetical protein [Flavobacterium album]